MQNRYYELIIQLETWYPEEDCSVTHAILDNKLHFEEEKKIKQKSTYICMKSCETKIGVSKC